MLQTYEKKVDATRRERNKFKKALEETEQAFVQQKTQWENEKYELETRIEELVSEQNANNPLNSSTLNVDTNKRGSGADISFNYARRISEDISFNYTPNQIDPRTSQAMSYRERMCDASSYRSRSMSS